MTIKVSPKSLKVLVIEGGTNGERDVSLMTGQDCYQAIKVQGYDVARYDYRGDIIDLLRQLAPAPDVVFNAMHGSFGEDGTLAAILQEMRIRYTHSDHLASAIGMDKLLTKQTVLGSVIRTIPARLVPAGIDLLDIINDKFMFPGVIKPRHGGSTVNLFYIENKAAARSIPRKADEDRLWESYIPGREFTVSVMDNSALAVTEIPNVRTGKIYDYNTKYVTGREAHLCPADLLKPEAAYISSCAETVHKILGCRGVTRSDFRWDDRLAVEKGLFFLEINTHPGLTKESLVPEQAEHQGIDFRNLVRLLIDEALERGYV